MDIPKMALLFFAVLGLGASAAAQTSIKSQTIVSVTTASTKLLDENLHRRYLLIINRGSDSIYVKADSAQSTTEGVVIPAGGNWEPYVVPINGFYFKSASGTQTVSIVSGN